MGGVRKNGPLQAPSGLTVKEVAKLLIDEKIKLKKWKAKKTITTGTTRLEYVVELLGPDRVFGRLVKRDVIKVRTHLISMIDPDRQRRSL